jgi:hypothetical protein
MQTFLKHQGHPSRSPEQDFPWCGFVPPLTLDNMHAQGDSLILRQQRAAAPVDFLPASGMMFELQKSNINGVVTGRIQGTDTVEFQYPLLPANEILRCQRTDRRQGGAVNQKEEEESKCREFVDQLNRLAAHERYRYIGHVSEMDGRYFPHCLVMDRRTSSELHVECALFAPEWSTVEKANVQILERRFADNLKDIGYESYDIFLQTRNPSEHPLQKLNRSGVEDLARNVKRFLADQRPKVGEQGVIKFNLDDFPTYVPLSPEARF